jgi:hypothetical protein
VIGKYIYIYIYIEREREPLWSGTSANPPFYSTQYLFDTSSIAKNQSKNKYSKTKSLKTPKIPLTTRPTAWSGETQAVGLASCTPFPIQIVSLIQLTHYRSFRSKACQSVNLPKGSPRAHCPRDLQRKPQR